MLIREATWVQVNGYSGEVQQGYKTYDEAWAAWVHALANNVVSPPPRIPTSASVPLPRTSTAHPPLIPDAHNVATPLPSDRNHQCAWASIASPSLPLQEP